VDTHKDVHVAVALDGIGRHRGTLSVPANLAGYTRLVDWAEEFGPLKHAGVEGTGSFGAGLTRFLKGRRIKVSEVIRPKRRDQYRAGKSDSLDAEAAARAVLAGTATGQPKSADGEVEMIRTLRITRRSAVKARVGAANQLQNLLITAPEGLKSELCGLSTARLVAIASRFRPGPNPSDVEAATKFALRSVARRYQRLSEEISELDEQLDRLVTEAAPELVAVEGVGTDTAASLLIAAGDNPERLENEAAFAHLCGAAPIPASSGKSVRHRLNRHGNRDANRALYVIAVCRMNRDERTRSYVAKRTAEGKSKKEIIRCLKRYIAREIYRVLSSISLHKPSISVP
jgi:transposase